MAHRRAAGTLATPTKAAIIRIKKNRGDTLPRPSLMDLQRDQRLRPWSYVAGGVTRLSGCDVMLRRHSDVCDVLRGCSDATTSCIYNPEQANTPAAFAKMQGGVFSGSQSLRISELGPDRMRSRTSMHTSRTSGHDLEDFRERRSVVCMIDRVCFVMYRCNYELLISLINLFHPTINTLQPGRLLRLWAAVTDCSVCG